jgi:hypothetical protein
MKICRLNNRRVRHEISRYVPERSPALPIILTKCPVSEILGLIYNSNLVGAQSGIRSGTSEYRRHSASTSEGPADSLHIPLRIRRMTARNCDRW